MEALIVTMEAMRKDLGDATDKIDAIDQRLKSIETMETTYKGGFFTILGLGALFGWVMNNLAWLKTLFNSAN